MSDEKNIEIKAKIILKKMPKTEYEAIMIPYKRLMLQFEKTLRQLADNNIISFSIVDKFTKEFNFADLQRLRFDAQEEQEPLQQRAQQAPMMASSQFNPPQSQPQSSFNFGQPAPSTSRGFAQQPQQQPMASGFGSTPQRQTAQRPSSFNFGQSQSPAPAPTSNFGFGKQESSNFQNPISSPRPGSTPPASSFGRQESSSNMFGQNNQGLGSFSDLSKDSNPATSFTPRSAPPTQPSFGLSNDFGSSQSKPAESGSKISVGIDEEDRATGIAILRKKMLMELRKIRNVVEQEDDSSF